MLSHLLSILITTAYAQAGVKTGIGTLRVTQDALTVKVLTLGPIFGGGVAILLVLKGGLELATSGGNPEQIKKGRETIVNALMGLAIILLSVVILKVVGDVLSIPLGF